jgi:hypothetical protein
MHPKDLPITPVIFLTIPAVFLSIEPLETRKTDGKYFTE